MDTSTEDIILTKEDVFERIANASFFGNLGLFIGAGLPQAILNSTRDKALSWEGLVKKCCTKMGIDFDSINISGASYPMMATLLCKKYAKAKGIEYKEAVDKLKYEISCFTSWYPESAKRIEYQNYFNSIKPSWIITTNYDLIIESVLTGKGYSLSPTDQLIAPAGFIPVYHLHGIRTIPSSIIINQEDYISLFRPNQYRQQKLTLTIKESLTVLIGYNMGDFNVLTAVDWSNNVFEDTNSNNPKGIIQFLFKKSPKENPYVNEEGMTIFEFDDMSTLLSNLSEYVNSERKEFEERTKTLQEINDHFSKSTQSLVDSFIADANFRQSIFDLLKSDGNHLISGFLELFSKSMDELWKRAIPRGAFEAYNENIIILLDILENIDIKTMPPALIETITLNLNRVSGMIGEGVGYAYNATDTWMTRKCNLSEETKREILNIADSRQYYRLFYLLDAEIED